MNSLGIYISVPFCRAKCTYCNFASGVSSVSAHEHYVARVCDEIRSVRRHLRDAGHEAEIPQVDSLYLGGGTPGVLSPALIAELGRTLRQEFAIAPEAEITLECAPGQLDDAALSAMLAFGVNRVSFGVQSLVDREAAATGRFHTREIVLRDLERVRAAGLRNLSIDLIAGIPHQTAASWQESLDVLVATGVDHASIYMLEIDQDSRLGRELLAGGSRYQALTVPSEELTADLYEAAIAFLDGQGLRQYEISNFARGQRQSQHNLKYWNRRPYLGFGLDAHSMVRDLDRAPMDCAPMDRVMTGSALRFSNPDVLPDYLRGDTTPDIRRLSAAEELEEAWFLGLRLHAGVCWEALAAEFGRDQVDRFLPVVEELSALDLLTLEHDQVRLTRRGVLFSNEVFARFLGVAQAGPEELLIQIH